MPPLNRHVQCTRTPRLLPSRARWLFLFSWSLLVASAAVPGFRFGRFVFVSFFCSLLRVPAENNIILQFGSRANGSCARSTHSFFLLHKSSGCCFPAHTAHTQAGGVGVSARVCRHAEAGVEASGPLLQSAPPQPWRRRGGEERGHRTVWVCGTQRQGRCSPQWAHAPSTRGARRRRLKAATLGQRQHQANRTTMLFRTHSIHGDDRHRGIVLALTTVIFATCLLSEVGVDGQLQDASRVSVCGIVLLKGL